MMERIAAALKAARCGMCFGKRKVRAYRGPTSTLPCPVCSGKDD